MKKKTTKKWLRGTVLVILMMAIVYTIYSAVTKEERQALQVGDVAPDFELVDLNGERHHLKEYKGTGVILNFWGTWCPPCKREMPAFNKQYAAYQDSGVEILSINIAQSELEVSQFIEEYQLKFPVMIDTKKSVMRAYGVDPLPTTIGISKTGEITEIVTGEMTEQHIQKLMQSVKLE
ncbi:thiol-disulfide oxidoreductase ResA [Kurthia senegalensis]|uniref:thiol-disulfide oxidoreductase ResA n=1 Tax=Kurthia senegalensis TaxID=1033740 RepID=UPI0002894DC6|nr:thiol-disulfide oxidoreductase ResA [Kurthia senegalensis]